jgi:hypothetical protein
MMIKLLAFLVGAAPFAFGVMRVLATGTDWRYLLVAALSFSVATAAFLAMTSRVRTAVALAAVSALALAASTLTTIVVAGGLALGSGPGFWIVVLSFALCATACQALRALSRAVADRNSHPGQE